MGAAGWLIRHRLRARWLALVLLVLIVALGATGTLVAAGAADRTSNAYSRFLDRSDVGDVVINPSLSSADIDEVIRDLPGVRVVTRDALFTAEIDEGEPRPLHETTTEIPLQVRGSVDGRYAVMDRPAVSEGRLPTGTNEALVSEELADVQDITIGDVLPVSFWRPGDELLLEPETVVRPLAVEQLTVVGIATFADEVLPDAVYPRQRLVVSPEIAQRYDCLPEVPPRDVTFEEAVAAMLPGDCATSYPYYSLELEGGGDDTTAALDAFLDAATELNADLPPSILSDNARYYLAATTTAQEQQRVERSTQPTVAALGVLAAAAAAITVIVLGLAVGRTLRRDDADQRQWWQQGMGTSERFAVLAVPMLVAIAVGLIAALLLAWVLSPIAPVGLVRSIDPSPTRELAAPAWLAALALGAVLIAGASALALRAARQARAAPVSSRRVSAVRRLVRGSARPEIDEGIRAAYAGGRGAGLVVASGAVAAALFMAATVFSTSLSSVLSTSASYGWPWDVALMGGSGYGEVDLEAARATLDSRDDIERWTGLGFTNSVAVDNSPVLTVIGLDQASDVEVTVVEGRLPVKRGEVALGSRTAADLDVGLGDEVDLTGDDIAQQSATVTGTVVLPALGPILADRAGPGTGMLLPAAALHDEAAALALSFIGVDLVSNADLNALLADLRDDFPSWDPFGEPAIEFAEPVRPPEIINAESMQAIPLLVGGLLVSTAVIGLVFAVVASVRSRRRDLAVLRALGFTGRQLRDSVRVQTVATILGALVVGVPIGIALGRFAWRAFASQLGVVTEPSTPVWWIVATIVGALAIALLASAVPARIAARTEPAASLRSE